MSREILQSFLRLCLLLAAQAMVFSSLDFSPLVNFVVFPMFVLLLPFATPRWLLMLIAVFTGWLLDLLLGTVAMHAACCLLIAYLRPFLITIITPKGTEFEISPNIHSQGLVWFLTYVPFSVAVYMAYYLLLESFTFYHIGWLLIKWVVGTLASTAFIFLMLYLFQTKKTRRFVSK